MVNLFIANTDNSWFDFLASEPALTEVNFWWPGEMAFRAIQPGELLVFRLKGTSNNCHRSSGTSNLLANDSALFSFRFYAVHPKDVRDCQLRQLFEVP